MIWMQNRILTNVKQALGDACKNVVSRRSNLSAKFPTCLVNIISNNSVADDLDIEDEEVAVSCGVNVEIYSKVSVSESINLMSLANGAMYRMGFRRIEGPMHVEDPTSPEVFRVVSRYTRIIDRKSVV